MNPPLVALLVSILLVPVSARSQTAKLKAKQSPLFEDYPVTEIWRGTKAPLKLTIRPERMFRTNLTKAAKEPPNFAGHYRMTYWGCGSLCSAGALVDLQTGDVFPPPLADPNGGGWDRWIMCGACFDGTGDKFRVDSRLMIVRCGLNYSERLQKNVPDVYYFVWEGTRFRQILFVSGRKSRHGQ